jgi:uncharacterized membrane protein YfcA
MTSTAPATRRIAAAVGATAGFASTLFGIGGGLILVPALSLLLGFPLKRAVATSLAAIVGIAAVGVAVEALYRPSNLVPLLAILLTAGSLVGARAGASLVHRIPERTLRAVFAAFLTLAAVRMLDIVHLPWATPSLSAFPVSAGTVAWTVGGGMLAGMTSSFFGVGGGIVAVPLLHLGLADVSFHAARATSLAMIVPTSAVGAVLHARLGHLDAATARRILPSGLAGAAVGVVVANHLAGADLGRAFAFVLLLASMRMIRRPTTSSPSLDLDRI